MTLDRAFKGLRLGLTMVAEEKGVRDGFFKLEELQKLLKKVPSR